MEKKILLLLIFMTAGIVLMAQPETNSLYKEYRSKGDQSFQRSEYRKAMNQYKQALYEVETDAYLVERVEYCKTMLKGIQMFKNGNYTKAKQSFELYPRNRDSKYYLGLMYKDGLGAIERDIDLAKNYLKQAQKLNHPKAFKAILEIKKTEQQMADQKLMDRFNKWKDLGTEALNNRNYDKSIGYFNDALSIDGIEESERIEVTVLKDQAKELDEAVQQYNHKKYKTARNTFENHLKNGDANYYLGKMYLDGNLGDINYKLAERFLREARRLGHPSAEAELSVIETRNRVAKEKERRKRAEYNQLIADGKTLFEQSKYIESKDKFNKALQIGGRDDSSIQKWQKKNDDFIIGMGAYQKRSYNKAYHHLKDYIYYSNGRYRGPKDALFVVGDILFSGKGFMDKDREKGIAYLTSAANMGHARAQQIVDDYNSRWVYIFPKRYRPVWIGLTGSVGFTRYSPGDLSAIPGLTSKFDTDAYTYTGGLMLRFYLGHAISLQTDFQYYQKSIYLENEDIDNFLDSNGDEIYRRIDETVLQTFTGVDGQALLNIHLYRHFSINGGIYANYFLTGINEIDYEFRDENLDTGNTQTSSGSDESDYFSVLDFPDEDKERPLNKYYFGLSAGFSVKVSSLLLGAGYRRSISPILNENYFNQADAFREEHVYFSLTLLLNAKRSK